METKKGKKSEKNRKNISEKRRKGRKKQTENETKGRKDIRQQSIY